MFVTKKHLSRRTVLRGLGATVALPLLDAMIPARTALAHTAGKPMPKLAFVYFPHGAIMNRWTPATEGKNFELSPLLAPLAPFKNQVTVVSGLENKHASGPTHAITPGTWLSGVSPRMTNRPACFTSKATKWSAPKNATTRSPRRAKGTATRRSCTSTLAFARRTKRWPSWSPPSSASIPPPRRPQAIGSDC